MILHKILDHDLHRSKSGANARPLMIETPAKGNFLPAVVSSIQWDRYIVVEKMTPDGRIRSGVFSHDSDRIDEIIEPMFAAAYKLSIDRKFKNVFSNPKAAFDFIQECSGTTAQPHVCLIPDSWSPAKLTKWAGKVNLEKGNLIESKKDGSPIEALTYRKVCRVLHCKISVPVFLSRPDFVGLYTQIVGGMTSILLHNVQQGMAFVS
jgi:hypothetical protein